MAQRQNRFKFMDFPFRKLSKCKLHIADDNIFPYNYKLLQAALTKPISSETNKR